MPIDTATVTAEPLPESPLPRPAPAAGQAPEFPGCHTIILKRDDLLDYDGRFEYWDGDTETAWVVSEPTSATHEQPSQRLAGLGQIIAGVRGSPIECYGTMDLLLRNEHGEKWRIMQADQSVYLHPAQARLPVDAMEIGEHDYPDVVLEVDHTTDVRRGKLGLYETWGFPEIWVDTPESGYAVKRPAGVSPGMTIYLLEGGVYRTAGQSRAFPGWTAVELHTAFNEEMLSPETSRVLRRVGRALGVREGTGPTIRRGCAWSATSHVSRVTPKVVSRVTPKVALKVAPPVTPKVAPRGRKRCWFAWRRGASTPGRRSGWPRCWPASTTRPASPGLATGSSSAPRAPSCWPAWRRPAPAADLHRTGRRSRPPSGPGSRRTRHGAPASSRPPAGPTSSRLHARRSRLARRRDPDTGAVPPPSRPCSYEPRRQRQDHRHTKYGGDGFAAARITTSVIDGGVTCRHP